MKVNDILSEHSRYYDDDEDEFFDDERDDYYDEPGLEDEWYDDDVYDDEEQMRADMFQDPGGNSALRRATRSNPRNLPCPTCGQENRLTPKDKALGYQCDDCADMQEFGY